MLHSTIVVFFVLWLCVCVSRFSSANFFFALQSELFLCVSHIEIWIIVTLYWAWHWSRRNRCALQPSRRVYHQGRTLFFMCYYIFEFSKRMGRKVNIFPNKGGKHIEQDRKMEWLRLKVMLCVWHFNISSLYFFTHIFAMCSYAQCFFSSFVSVGLNLRFFLSIE